MKTPMVTISPSDEASLRTKNRIRENGPEFWILAGPKPVTCFGGWCQAVFCGSIRKSWSGWFPLSEIEMDNEQ